MVEMLGQANARSYLVLIHWVVKGQSLQQPQFLALLLNMHPFNFLLQLLEMKESWLKHRNHSSRTFYIII